MKKRQPPPPEVHLLTPRPSQYIPSYGKTIVQMWLRILMWTNYPGVARWGPHKRKTETPKRRRWRDDSSGDWSDALRRQRKGPQDTEYRWLLEAEKGREMDSPLRASGRNQPCQHLDFSPVKLILNFWHPELQRSKLHYFKLPSMWEFVTATIRN